MTILLILTLWILLNLIALDWWQTLRIATSNGYWVERNPILGKYPRVIKVNVYFSLVLAIILGLVAWVPMKYSVPALGIATLIQALVVWNNIRIGIGYPKD